MLNTSKLTHLFLYRLFLALTLGWVVSFYAHAFELTDAQMAKMQQLPANSAGLKSSLSGLRETAKSESKNVEARIRLSKALLATGSLTDAIEILKTINGDIEPKAHLLLDVAYKMTEQYKEQTRILELLRKRKSDSKYLILRLGQAYLDSKNPKTAVEVYKDCKVRFPESRDCYFGLLSVYESTKNNYETRVLLTDMAKLFKADAVVSARLCQSYATNSFIDQGLEICEKSIKVQPSLADSQVYFALLKRYNKEPEVSERLLKQVAAKFPRSELAQWNLGQLLMEQKNYEAAKRTYGLCTEHNSNSDRCWLGKATAIFELKDYRNALNGYVQACKINVKNRTPFRAAITQLRIQNLLDLSSVYSTEYDKCGLNAATE